MLNDKSWKDFRERQNQNMRCYYVLETLVFLSPTYREERSLERNLGKSKSNVTEKYENMNRRLLSFPTMQLEDIFGQK